MTKLPKSFLIDARNAEHEIPKLKALIARSKFPGLDLETEDSRRHDGLNRFCKFDEEGYKSKGGKTVFDFRRTVICGASFFSEEDPDQAYYVNFGHKDAENRLPVGVLLELLACRAEGAYWVAHNSAFEQTVLKAVLGYEFPPNTIICTLTQAVSAYGPDTYSHQAWMSAGQGEIAQLVPRLLREAQEGYDVESGEMSPALSELVFKIIGKSSKAAFSWNGFVKTIAYGYNLKQAVLSHFNYRMTTFDEVLGEEAHMGMLTGEQVVDYGADDAYWAVRLFRHLLVYMINNGGEALFQTFMEQENPMPKVFTDIAIGGMRVNHAAIGERTKTERAAAAGILREMKEACRELRWPAMPSERLLRYEKWYGYSEKGDKWGWETYRAKVQAWLDQPDVEDDYQQLLQVRGAVTIAWAAEHGVNEKAIGGVNLSHYMPVRVILYDLIGAKVLVSQGKVQSDGEARGRIVDSMKDGRRLPQSMIRGAHEEIRVDLQVRIDAGGDDAIVATSLLEDEAARWHRIEAAWDEGDEASREDLEPYAMQVNRHGLKIIDCLNRLAGVEQRMKLYLTPYSMLVDPETNCMYPSVTSMLATRRMAASNPNAMQLGKRGESAYIRGFFLGDYDDHVMVSLDWSGVELVEIGEFSGDPKFFEAFGQIPHQDLHAGTATALLALDCPGLTLDTFKSLKTMTSWNEWLSDNHGKAERLPRLMTNLKGELLTSNKAYGYWRTVFGKEANFNYFYSGWLATIGERAGWSQQKTADATAAYRDQFPVAEQWRVRVIEEVAREGFLTLPDHHRYTRYEATMLWASEWANKFMIKAAGQEDQALDAIIKDTLGEQKFNAVMRWISRKIQKRAGNQAVNAYIQGTCATLAKRSIVRTIIHFKSLGWTDRDFRLIISIHDELVWSVRQDLVVQFVRDAHRIMVSHDDIFKRCKLDSSPAVGITFEPWNEKKAPAGQIELFEPEAAVVGKDRAGKRLDDQGILDVVEYLKEQRNLMKRAA